jgi:hypothetical protein
VSGWPASLTMPQPVGRHHYTCALCANYVSNAMQLRMHGRLSCLASQHTCRHPSYTCRPPASAVSCHACSCGGAGYNHGLNVCAAYDAATHLIHRSGNFQTGIVVSAPDPDAGSCTRTMMLLVLTCMSACSLACWLLWSGWRKHSR